MSLLLSAGGWRWAGGCVALSGATFSLLPTQCGDVPTRFEWSMRVVEGCHALWMAFGALGWLRDRRSTLADWTLFAEIDAAGVLTASNDAQWLGLGGLPALMETMAGFLVVDTLFDVALPLLRRWCAPPGERRSLLPEPAFVVHHLVGLAAHVVARRSRHMLLAQYAPYIYLAEFSTPFLHASWMLNVSGRSRGGAFLLNGSIGAAAYLVFRILLPPVLLWRVVAGGDRAWRTASSSGDDPSVFRAYVGTLGVFVALNLFWFRTLVEMVLSKTRTPKEKKTE